MSGLSHDILGCHGERHMTDESGVARCFDVNTKLAAAKINAGVGETQISNILATLNIPYPCHKTVKKREREIRVTIEKVAEESCSKAIAEEIAATIGDCATVLLDGGWQKRGSGQNHNSLSGHLAVIGKESKKCVSFGAAKKSCRKCKNRQKGKENIHEHGCTRNSNGSSKAMESFLAVRGLKKLKNRGLNVKRIVMDDDSTAYVRIKNSFDCDIEKCSDKNHVTKGFTNDLYKLKEKNNKLSVTIINYIRKCFNYAVTQNKGNPKRMKSSLVASLMKKIRCFLLKSNRTKHSSYLSIRCCHCEPGNRKSNR